MLRSIQLLAIFLCGLGFSLSRSQSGLPSQSKSQSQPSSLSTSSTNKIAARANAELASMQFGQGQDRFGGLGGQGRGGRQSQSQRSDYPQWDLNPNFKSDVFTFVRIQFDSLGGGGRGGGQGWSNDFPDCDWNFSVRLTQLTSFKVHPEGVRLRLSDEALFDYPFIFMTNLGAMQLNNVEEKNLGRYLLNGGFLMADDFWAAASWNHIRLQMQRVLPNREPVELTLDHPIFHTVYDLTALPQVPSIIAWQRGMTYEDWHGPFERGDTSPHFWGYFDDNGRLMAIFCHNNDLADGWEREGENPEYFRNYSVKWSFPFGINMVVYAMSN